MAQAQIDSDFTFTEPFQKVHCQLKYDKIVCILNESVSLTITQQGNKDVIILKSGKKQIKLSKDIFDALCDSKVSVDYFTGCLQAVYTKHNE